ncbi:hypothetical protein [Neisseria weaveri]|uniref:Uncharacterized protein n=1 Tax=Neisseria weaveri TaxID=28091 RepID=A0A448VKY3_9NEIS|nr:hypothetical protein [Neisseria weaveri]EGV38779.1 RHS protein [Neisseria weaveri LMG 5135]SAY51421.1 Uncharacterised protein [Neisseria weaveri]VEJ50450.1 Uncharacterised protein [Neisseria weaveri]
MKKLILSAFVSLGLVSLSAPSHAFNCLEYKTFASHLSGKEAAKDAPSWVRQAGLKPCKNPNESGTQFAKRVLDAKYGAGKWKTGPATEHNQIKKYGDRAFN